MASQDYNEELQRELETRPLFILLLESVLSVVSVLAIVTGNSLVLLATRRNRRLRRPANYYIVSLAFTDLFAALLAYPLTAAATISGGWKLGRFGCYWVLTSSYTFANASIFTMLLIAVNRYFRIMKSSKYPTIFSLRFIVTSIVMAWVLAMGCPLILLCWGSEVIFNPGYVTCVPVASKPGDIAVFLTVSFIWAGLPIFLISLLYYKIWVFIKHHNAHMNGSQVTPEELKLTKSMFVVVGSFMACYLPYVATATLEVLFLLRLPRQYFYFCSYMVMSASYINPFIYAAMNRHYRKEIFKILSSCRGANGTVRPVEMG